MSISMAAADVLIMLCKDFCCSWWIVCIRDYSDDDGDFMDPPGKGKGLAVDAKKPTKPVFC
jgi:hypothetical protein